MRARARQYSRQYPRRVVQKSAAIITEQGNILGQQAMNVASDMIDGKSFKDSAKSP